MIIEGWPTGPYGLIAADPPWKFKTYSDKGLKKSAQSHYRCMTRQEIMDLPVAAMAAKDCLLMLWSTWPMLETCQEVMRSWGFKYKTGAHWHKLTKHGKQAFGPGYIIRGASEPILIGTRGSPKTTNSTRNALEGIARQHSRKPEEFYPWAEGLMPDTKRIELFSRTNRPDWDVWGDEVGKFKELAS